MNLLSSHSNLSDDALLRPVFGLRSKVARLLWYVIWSLLFRPTPTPMHNYRCWLLRRFGAQIGKQNFIYPSAQIWAPWLLKTEEVVTIGPYSEIYNPGGISLGHHTIISQDAYLCGASHDYNSADFTFVAKTITTEPYAWVCARSIVLPGVQIGEGAVLGAGSVTSRNLEAWTVYAGNPAKNVKSRTNFLCEAEQDLTSVY